LARNDGLCQLRPLAELRSQKAADLDAEKLDRVAPDTAQTGTMPPGSTAGRTR
jgi:hypothetical protein